MIKKITIQSIQNKRNNNEKITALTAYDYSTARYIDECGVDIVLVGDSLANVALGYNSTQQVGMNEMKIFTGAVARGVNRALVVADMPFMSCSVSVEDAMINIRELVKVGAQAVKIEGYNNHTLSVVKRCTEAGIPVVGHLGFTPQYIHQIGGYKVQGKTDKETELILEQAKQLENAGVFSIVLEMVPENSAKYITENISIPTIGIGAGVHCSGQILVTDDLLGKFSDYSPKFVRRYANLKEVMTSAIQGYCDDVRNEAFPSKDESFHQEGINVSTHN